MSDSKILKRFSKFLIVKVLVLYLMIGHLASSDAAEYSLVFDENRFSEKTINVDDKTIAYRSYEGISYVSKPVDTRYQTMNFYVPSEYYQGKSIRNYTKETAPIFLPNTVGGYMPGAAGRPGRDRGNLPNTIALALVKGYIVASPGARGRTLKDEKGLYTGKAPACIVDLKGAVRYLRHNDKIMPGDAEKIISNGTSAGGALSSLLGATGNSPDYEPYLKAIGAATERDNIFAASCYCPITNLENGDTAYEWLFYGVNSYDGWGKTGTINADQIRISDQLKALFPGYLNSLKLKKTDGSALNLDEDGEGSFKDYVKSFVIASAQNALDKGQSLSDLGWITIKDEIVEDIDLGRFIAYATRMKTPPAFDTLDLSSPENSLFGTETIDNQHFTQFAMDKSTNHSLAERKIVKMMNPMNYIGANRITTAKYWRIRHGAVDRDTSLAIPVILTTKLQNNGFNVDFALPWGQGHGGDYDPDELFAWIDMICSESENH
jgi:hypothetical protein